MSQNQTDVPVITSALQALGVAIFAGVAAVTGVLLRWLVRLDGSYDQANLDFAHLLIGAGSVVALGALLVVAKALVSLPRQP
ncbi:MAG: hypothetical protein ACLGH4_08925 [Actinomycetes bacterium]